MNHKGIAIEDAAQLINFARYDKSAFTCEVVFSAINSLLNDEDRERAMSEHIESAKQDWDL